MYNLANLKNNQPDEPMKRLHLTDDFLDEVSKEVLAQREPIVPPEGLSLVEKARYIARMEAYRAPLSSSKKPSNEKCPKRSHTSKVAAFLSSLVV